MTNPAGLAAKTQARRGLRPLWDRLLLVHLQTCGTPNKAGNQKPRVYTAGGCNQRAKYKRISISRAWDETPGGTGKKKKQTKQNSQCERISVWQLQTRQRRKDDKANTSRQRVCARECARVKAPTPPPSYLFCQCRFGRRRSFPDDAIAQPGGAGGGGATEVPGEARCHTSRFWPINTD